MKKVINILIWLVIIAYFIVAMSFVNEKQKNILCNNIQVSITDSSINGFIKQSDIREFFHQSDMKVMGSPVVLINTKELEKKLQEYSAVKNAEVYVTMGGDICVNIDQRNPILRVINKRGNSYYIDEDGTIMPLSNKFSSHVLIANGHIVEHFEINKSRKIPCKPEELQQSGNTIMCDLYTLGKFINGDEFWKAQIEQIYVNDNYEYELVPRVGAHIINLGSINDYEKKFRNLKAFYVQGLNKVGWNKYEKINLKYENQVICTKR